MITRPIAGLAAASLLAGAALLAGCTSSAPGPAPSTAGRPATASGLTSAALATKLDAALTALTSAHLEVDAGALGGRSSADVALEHGRATAIDVHLTKSGQPVEEVTAGGTSYVKVPNASGKPWVRVSPTSANPVAKSLATGIGVTALTSSLGIVTALVKSSSDLTARGSEQLGGVSTTHYTMKLNPKQVTGAPQLSGLLGLLGDAQLPVDLWLDGHNRPVKFVIHVALGGSQFPVAVRVSKFDVPVSIAAPPPGQVSAG